MSIADAVGWGAAIASIGVAAVLAASAVHSIVTYLAAEQDLKDLDSAFSRFLNQIPSFWDSPDHETREQEIDGGYYRGFGYVRSAMFSATLWQSNPDLFTDLRRPGVVGVRVASEFRKMRNRIGSLPILQLRKLKQYRQAMDFVAAYEAGVADARNFLFVARPKPDRQ